MEEFGQKQLLGILGVIAALFGLLVMPFLVQRFYGISAFKVAFVVIVVYAVAGWCLGER